MPKEKTIHFDDIGPVLLKKSKRSKHINIIVEPYKCVRVTVPYRVSFKEGEEAARSRVKWILKQQKRMKAFEKEYFIDIPDLFWEEEAKGKIENRTTELALEHGFKFSALKVRRQKTRWGSCSYKNNISLNIKLGLLPDELFDYVILHELMHTRHKNHSKDFWGSLDSIVGRAKELDAELKEYHLELM